MLTTYSRVKRRELAKKYICEDSHLVRHMARLLLRRDYRERTKNAVSK
jgi:hypothetical protein